MKTLLLFTLFATITLFGYSQNRYWISPDTSTILATKAKVKADSITLMTAIGLKQDALVSGTNLKTLGGASLLGSGNIALPAAVDTTSLSTRINTKVNTGDTAAMLSPYINNILFNNSGLIHTSPASFSFSGHTATLSQTLATQSAYSLLGRGSGSGSPSWQNSIDSNWIPFLKVNSLALPVSSINATGTPSSTTYLRGDGSWATVAGGAAWGGITGTLSSQTDLQTALTAKAPTANATFTGTFTTPLITSSGTVNAAVGGASNLFTVTGVLNNSNTQWMNEFISNVSGSNGGGSGTVYGIYNIANITGSSFMPPTHYGIGQQVSVTGGGGTLSNLRLNNCFLSLFSGAAVGTKYDYCARNTFISSGTLTTQIGFYSDAMTSGGSNAAIMVGDCSGSSGSGNLILGQTSIPSGNWSMYNSSTKSNYIAGTVLMGTTSVNSSAVLDVVSTTKGVSFCPMTQAQRTAISSPKVGLIVYQTDGTEGYYVNKSDGWHFAF